MSTQTRGGKEKKKPICNQATVFYHSLSFLQQHIQLHSLTKPEKILIKMSSCIFIFTFFLEKKNLIQHIFEMFLESLTQCKLLYWVINLHPRHPKVPRSTQSKKKEKCNVMMMMMRFTVTKRASHHVSQTAAKKKKKYTGMHLPLPGTFSIPGLQGGEMLYGAGRPAAPTFSGGGANLNSLVQISVFFFL